MIRLAFLSSTCPEWTFAQMVEAAARSGYEGIDLRAEWNHRHGLELDTAPHTRREAREYAAGYGVAISCVAISAKFARATAAEREEAVEQVKRYAELAADLGSPLLRVFGGNLPQGQSMAELRPATAEALGRAAAVAAPYGVTPCLETHDQHNHPDDVAWIVEQAAHRNVGVVWHTAHHLRLGISVDEAYARLGRWVRHVHLAEHPKGGDVAERESQQERDGGARTPFIPFGEGDGHLARVFALLAGDRFEGYAANEWIIKRHVEAEPEVHLARAAQHLKAWREAAQQAA